MSTSLKKLRELLKNDFAEYLKFALKYQGFTATKSQLEMANHLQYGGAAVGCMAMRGASKTTIGSIHYVNWRHLRCPHLKVLILSGKQERAQEIARKLHDNYTNMPWLKHMEPTGSMSEISYNITGSERETTRSITSVGVCGNFTGLRSDLVVFDDAQQAKQTSTVKYEQILVSIGETEAVLRPITTRPKYWFKECPWYDEQNFNIPDDCPERTNKVVLGTYQDTFNDIYTLPDDKDEPHFMRPVVLKKWPALIKSDNGHEVDGMVGRWESNFAQIIPFEELMKKKKTLSRKRWALEYMLDKEQVPRDEDALLNMQLVTSHCFEDKDVENVANWYIVIDPADMGGDSFCATEMTPYQGSLFVRNVMSWKKTSSEICLERIMARVSEAKDIRHLYYEQSFAALGTVINMIRQRHASIRVAVTPFHNRTNKIKRITETLEPTLHSGKMRLHKRILYNNRECRNQLEQVRQGALPVHDDFLDTLALGWGVFRDKVQISGGNYRITDTFVA